MPESSNMIQIFMLFKIQDALGSSNNAEAKANHTSAAQAHTTITLELFAHLGAKLPWSSNQRLVRILSC
jgi:hypothetical protein